MKLRRLGPSIDVARCALGRSCPDVFQLEDGDFAVIGTDITAETIPHLPSGSGCGPSERIVRIPKKVMVLARPDIPEAP